MVSDPDSPPWPMIHPEQLSKLHEPLFSRLRNGGHSTESPRWGMWKALHSGEQPLPTINVAGRGRSGIGGISTFVTSLRCGPRGTLWLF